MNHIFKVVGIVDGRVQWRTRQESGVGFTECDFDVVDAVLLEKSENILRGLQGDFGSRTTFMDADPDSHFTGNLASAPIFIRLIPPKADEVNRGERDPSLVKQFSNLGMESQGARNCYRKSPTLSRTAAHRSSLHNCA